MPFTRSIGATREGFFLQVAEALETDPLLRVLFIIREDYLAHLDPYAGLLPEGLRTRFRLERLRSDAARLAVERPLQGTGRAFAAGVASTLVQELVGIRVESTAGEASRGGRGVCRTGATAGCPPESLARATRRRPRSLPRITCAPSAMSMKR